MRKILIYIFYFVFLWMISHFSSHQLHAQSRVSILEADSAQGVLIDGQSVRKILGDVILQTEEMVMETDSAYHYVTANLLTAFNIQIVTENEMIWADTLHHDVDTEISRLRGRVIVQSDENIMFSDSIDVDMKTDIVTLNVPVRFEDEQGTLIAESGLYFQEADSAIFRGNVQLADSSQYLEADSLFMNRASELYELFGHVYANDFEDDVRFTGEYLFADSLGNRLLEKNAWMMEVSESKEDTTHLFAERIELLETDSTSYMDAYQNVRMWSWEFSATADTANYREDLDQFILRSSPILWHNNIQLSGPYIEAYMEDDNIRFLTSFQRPIVVQEDSLTGRLHQMTGDTLNAYFENGELERIRIYNNTEIIFHQRDENNQPDGLIELISAGPSTMFFVNDEFDFFRAERNIDGTYLPEDPSNVDRQLDNFQWNPEQRPQRPEIQTPRLPPIPDELPFELPPRYLRYLESQVQEGDSEASIQEPE